MADLWIAGVIVFGLISAFLIVLVVAQATDNDFEPLIPLEFGVAGLFGNLVDAALHLRGSQWISVLGALFAIALTIGCYFGWRQARAEAPETHHISAAEMAPGFPSMRLI